MKKNITLCLCGLEGDDYDMMKIIAIMVIMMLIATFTRIDFQIHKRQYLCKDYQNRAKISFNIILLILAVRIIAIFLLIDLFIFSS